MFGRWSGAQPVGERLVEVPLVIAAHAADMHAADTHAVGMHAPDVGHSYTFW
jgi:hypothetical protein